MEVRVRTNKLMDDVEIWPIFGLIPKTNEGNLTRCGPPIINGTYDWGWGGQAGKMQTSQIFALTKDDPHPKIGGDILGGQCYARLLNRSFYFETSGSTTQGDFFLFFLFFFCLYGSLGGGGRYYCMYEMIFRGGTLH